MMAVLFDRAARHDANLAQLDRIIDLRRSAFHSEFSGSSAHSFDDWFS